MKTQLILKQLIKAATSDKITKYSYCYFFDTVL